MTACFSFDFSKLGWFGVAVYIQMTRNGTVRVQACACADSSKLPIGLKGTAKMEASDFEMEAFIKPCNPPLNRSKFN